MPRLLSSLLLLLLGFWPSRPNEGASSFRASRLRRLRSRSGAPEDAQDPVEAPDRARARSLSGHQWPGELIFTSGAQRRVVRGRWRFTHDPLQRAQEAGAAGELALDPSYAEGWETQLEALLTLQVPGARLHVKRADTEGWRLLELRAPTLPETVVQVDGAAVAQILASDAEDTRLELRIFG